MTPSAEVNLTALRITSRLESGVLAFGEAEAGLDETGSVGAVANRGGSAGSAEGKRLEVVVAVLEMVDPAEANEEAVAVLAAEDIAEEAAYGCPAYETACPAKGGLPFAAAAVPPTPLPTGAGTEELLAFRCPLP